MMFRQPPFRDFPAYVKILSLLLVVISNALLVMAVGMSVGVLIFGKDILSVLSEGVNYSDPHVITALKYFQIVNQFGVFILPALAFVVLTDDDMPGYLKLRGQWHGVSILTGIVLILVSLPMTYWLMDINNSIQLPHYLSGVENWMQAKEQEASDLTDAFLSTKTIGGFIVNQWEKSWSSVAFS